MTDGSIKVSDGVKNVPHCVRKVSDGVRLFLGKCQMGVINVSDITRKVLDALRKVSNVKWNVSYYVMNELGLTRKVSRRRHMVSQVK